MTDFTDLAQRMTQQAAKRRARLYPVAQEALERAETIRNAHSAAQGQIANRRVVGELVGLGIPGFFPTPHGLAARMVAIANIRAGMTVLEPSAGSGNIAEAIRVAHPDATLYVVEYNATLNGFLARKVFDVVGCDFLDFVGAVDRIIMNPPFERGQDISHVMHAYDCLKPGGRIVAIMSAGTFSRGDKQATSFREWLDDVGGYAEPLPAETFKTSENPTSVQTYLVTIDKT